MEEKEKIRVAPPYADRRSRQYEVISSDGPCPRCFNRMTIRETEQGDILWCYNCGYIQGTPNNAAIV